MKKHLGLLFLFVMQNACAMELDPLAMTLKYDEKCKLVAKYLYKYPQGENNKEARRIKNFLKDVRPHRVALVECINKYKNMLHNIEVEEFLDGIFTQNLPGDIKQKIFTEVLWGYAAQYYAINNALKFIAIDKTSLVPYYIKYIHILPPRRQLFHAFSSLYYIPCFLAEIQENNSPHIIFSEKDLYNGKNSHKNLIHYYNSAYGRDSVSVLRESEVKLFCHVVSDGFNGFSWPIKCEKVIAKDIFSFLETRNYRVAAFKKLFNQQMEDISKMNDKEGVGAFIEALALYKKLPKIIADSYKSQFGKTASIMLQSLPSMYERETNKKPAKKSAIICTINL
jgi:hypothetical protein